MSGFVLLFLTLGIFKNEIACATLGERSKFEEKSLPRAARESPSHWTRFNSKYPSENNVDKSTINATSNRFDREAIEQRTRQAKFLPKFSILAGLNIDTSVPRGVANLTPIAKIVQANGSPSWMNPYFAASYDPYPSSGAMQQSIRALYGIVERLTMKVDHISKHRVDSATGTDALSTSANADIAIDDKKRNKSKLKKTKSKRKKHEDVSVEDDVETYDDDEMPLQTTETFSRPRIGSKNGARKDSNARQAATVRPSTTTTTDTSSMENDNPTGVTPTRFGPTRPIPTNATTEQPNATYSTVPGYYYGGHPQPIDHVGFTYDKPHQPFGSVSDNYGPPLTNYGSPPSYNYGAPTFSYGAPSFSYGSPSYSYGPPSRGYGPPSQSYEIGPHALHDSEAVVYDDPNLNSFAPVTSERWLQRVPFARSRKASETTSDSTTIANRNGFVPI